MVARLPRHIAERELKVLGKRLGWPPDCLHVEEVEHSRGPGNVVMAEVESEYANPPVYLPPDTSVVRDTIQRKLDTMAY